MSIIDSSSSELVEAAVIKQVAAKMTGFGFPNSPSGAKAHCHGTLSDSIAVFKIVGLAYEDVFALVVEKRHSPSMAWHVVDFRVGTDIYGD